MLRVYVAVCGSFIVSGLATCVIATTLMPPPRVAPTMAHRFAVCGSVGTNAGSTSPFYKAWFTIHFTPDQKIRRTGDDLLVEELSQHLFNKPASELTEIESAVVGTVARRPRINLRRLVRDAHFTLMNCSRK